MWSRFFLLAAALFLVVLLRLPNSLTNPQFWAEDATVYFHDQASLGPWGAVFKIYAEYLSLLQRLIALGAALFPASYAPLLYAICGGIVAGLCCATFYLPWFRHILPSDVLRLACCVLAGSAIYCKELIGNTVNLQWWMLLAGVLLVFRDLPERAVPVWQSVLWTILGALCGFTMPLLIITVPFCLWRLWRKRDATSGYEIALTLAVSAQVWIFLHAPKHLPVVGADLLRTLDNMVAAGIVGFLYRGVLSTLGGFSQTYSFIGLGYLGAPQALLVLLTLGIAALWAISRAPDRWNISIALFLGLSAMMVGLNGRRLTSVFANISSYPEAGGERYFFLSACVFIYLTALALSKVERIGPQAQACLLVAVFLFGIVQNYRCPPLKDLNWRDYAASVDNCIRQRRAGKNVGVSVPVNPEPWRLSIP